MRACSGCAPAGEVVPAALTPLFAAGREPQESREEWCCRGRCLTGALGPRAQQPRYDTAPSTRPAQVPLQRGIPTFERGIPSFGQFAEEEEGIPLPPKDAESQHLRTWVSTGTVGTQQENRMCRISLGQGIEQLRAALPATTGSKSRGRRRSGSQLCPKTEMRRPRTAESLCCSKGLSFPTFWGAGRPQTTLRLPSARTLPTLDRRVEGLCC